MATSRIERHPRRVRRIHAATYLITTGLLFTGWWLVLGREGQASPLSRITGMPDTQLHIWLGRALAIVVLLIAVAGSRGVTTFVRETARRDPTDARWWRSWPAGAMSGRFARHEGLFDPGQRIANVVLVGGLLVLTASGIVLTLVHGGPVFAWVARLHRWTTFAVTPVILGHVLIAMGVLPGYAGVARSMHLDGRVREDSARRVWPGWTERTLREADAADRAEEGNEVPDRLGASTDGQHEISRTKEA
jgi:cytochrome b subunit of formate dehydrogenase